MILIDSDHYENAGIEVMFFPDKTPHAKVPDFRSVATPENPIVFMQRLRTWDDIGYAACVNDALRWQFNDDPYCFVPIIPYMPGARQERANPPGSSPVMLAMMDELLGPHINLDLHNPKWRGAAWSSAINVMPSALGLPMRPEVDFVIAPDAGAVDRARDFANAYCPNASLICATKERDPKTGKLSNYQLPVTEQGKIYLVVDDICDGGGTFRLLAEAFWKGKPPGAYHTTRLELFVTHGIFSKGLHPLCSGQVSYHHIYTTDSFYQPRVTRDEVWLAHLTVYALNKRIGKMLEAYNDES